MKLSTRHPIRLLTAVPLCDGHDSAINTINQELIQHGFEVIYMGYHRSAEAIVRAAIQEDVVAIGISSYNGGHIEFFREIVHLLKKNKRPDIGVFGGGGGTITPDDVKIMVKDGVDAIYLAGTSFDYILNDLTKRYSKKCSKGQSLAELLTQTENGETFPAPAKGNTKVIGITGPGGAGKTTLIDEWVRGALIDQPELSIGILSHDPSSVSRGGLLGDRASMIYCEDDRVFIRSMATRGQQGGLSIATEDCLKWMTSKKAGFDIVFIETVGTGQEALPFSSDLIDHKVLVLHPEYGARLQLQKILMLDCADTVVLNKSDWSGAARALQEIKEQSKTSNIFTTHACQHNDKGVKLLRKEWLS